MYPTETVQTDLVVFSAIFTHVWNALEVDGVFLPYYEEKKVAFDALRFMITPDPSSPWF